MALIKTTTVNNNASMFPLPVPLIVVPPIGLLPQKLLFIRFSKAKESFSYLYDIYRVTDTNSNKLMAVEIISTTMTSIIRPNV